MKHTKGVVIVSVLALLSALALAGDVSSEARALHDEAFVADLHADTHFMITYFGYNFEARHHTMDWGPAGVGAPFSDIDLPRLKEGGVDLFTFAICPVPKDNKYPGAAAFVRRSLNTLDRLLIKFPDQLGLARSPAEAREIAASGRVAVLAAVEGGSAIEESLDVLHEFFDRGARYLTLTHAKTLTWAESGSDGGSPDINGLTDFGREVVREMERMGMMIDLAHVSPETFWAVLNTVKCPVIVTHAAAAGIAPHHRNLSDDQIRAIAERGGVIGVIYAVNYLDPSGTKPKDVGLVADHIDYIRKVGGIDVIALGSDWDGGIEAPAKLGDASRLPNLTAELLRRGYTHEEIKKILGENFLRAWTAIEAAAIP